VLEASPASFTLQRLDESHRAAFAGMQANPAVMADLGGPSHRADSDAKFDRYCEAWASRGLSCWAVVGSDARFLGYCGVMYRDDASHPLGLHHEIGWRFCRHAWGQGLASRSAELALHHAWTVYEADIIWS
jgi:RimJ/RimL family protein N-acetyltransferase